MGTSRKCKVCPEWHPLEDPWPESCLGHFRPRGAASGQIIKDIDPYRTVAADQKTGKRIGIGSRREHREFLKRNDLVEVGNDIPRPQQREVRGDFSGVGRDIKTAIDQLRGQGRIK